MSSFSVEQLFAAALSFAQTHPRDKVARAHALLLADGVASAGALDYYVTASGGGSYLVTIGGRLECSCRDFAQRGGRCKHILAAEIHYSLSNPAPTRRAR